MMEKRSMNAPVAAATVSPGFSAARDDAKKIGLTSILKNSGLAAGVVLLLSIPIIAYRTNQNANNELYVYSRWWLVGLFVAATFVFRFLRLSISAYRANARLAAPQEQVAGKVPGRIATSGSRILEKITPLAAIAFVTAAIAFPLVATAVTGSLGSARYWFDLGILILTYVMLGWGLNIVVGLAGLLDLGYVAFYAVGAYSYALLSTHFGLSFWICLPLAGILSAFWGIILGFPILRLRGDYLAIVTLAFGEIIRLVLVNWQEFSNGAAGISSIPRITFFGLPFSSGDGGFAATFGLTYDPMHRMVFLYYLILTLALITNIVTIRLRRLPVGRAWEALREDETACRALGINTRNTKLTAFALGAMFGGFAGSFFAVRQGLVSPESFNFMESAIILAIVVLGGMGSQIGVAIAAVVLVGAPELLRNLTFLKSVFGESFDPNEYRLVLFGLGMVAMMVWRPRGLISTREPSVTIGKRKGISAAHVKEGHG